MVISFTANPFQQMIINYSKNLTRTPVTKTENPMTGDETLTEGTPETIQGAFFRREDVLTQEQEVLLQNADALAQFLPTVTINFNDLIEYDGEVYRVTQPPVTRRIGTTVFYIAVRLFKNE